MDLRFGYSHARRVRTVAFAMISATLLASCAAGSASQAPASGTVPPPHPASTLPAGSASPVASPTPYVSGQASQSAFEWVQSDIKGANGPAKAVFAWSGGYVVTYQLGPTVFASRDGQAWGNAVPLKPAGGDPFNFLAEGPKGLLGVSSTVSCETGASTCKVSPPLLWMSANGSAWDQIQDVSALGSDSLIAAAGGGKGYLIAGPKTLFYSADGRSWQSTSGIQNLVRFTSAIADSHGFEVAGVVSASGGQSAAVWTSIDGASWTRTVLGAITTNSEAQIHRVGMTLVVSDVVTLATGPGTAWTSVDGKTWTKTDEEHQVFWSDGSRAIAISDDGVFVSTDGLSWTKVSTSGDSNFSPKGSSVDFAAMGPSGLVVQYIGSVWLLLPPK
jgi:hypothetical protein